MASDLHTAERRIRHLERENARLLTQLAEQQLLVDAGRMANLAILERLGLTEVLQTLLDSLAQLIPSDAACVMMLNDQRQAVVEAGIGYQSPLETGRLAFAVDERPHLEELVQQMRSVVVEDTRQARGWQHGVEVSATTRSWLGVPLIARGKVLGLYALDSHTPGFFTPRHVRLAETLAAHAALAIANARLVER